MFCSGWQKLKACGESGQLMESEAGCLGRAEDREGTRADEQAHGVSSH